MFAWAYSSCVIGNHIIMSYLDIPHDPFRNRIRKELSLNPPRGNYDANLITIYSYNVFNWLFYIDKKDEGLVVHGIGSDNGNNYELMKIRLRNLIANIFNYIWYILSPSISFDVTTIFKKNR